MVRYDTLCHIINDHKLLLIKKTAGLFGGGKWNGLGGKIGVEESPEQACIREVYEESGLRVTDLQYHGILTFWFGDAEEPAIVCYIFSTKAVEGQLKQGPEGILRWTDFKDIPYEEMWEDDRYWLPLLMDGKSFDGEFHFNKDGSKLLNHKLETAQ